MKIRKLIALLATLLMLASVVPVSAFAEMGGDFPWTGESEQMLIEQIPAAPQKAYYVTIRYEKDGLFDWKGDYETMEFADAISGGMNTAYNALYARMLKELEDLLG